MPRRGRGRGVQGGLPRPVPVRPLLHARNVVHARRPLRQVRVPRPLVHLPWVVCARKLLLERRARHDGHVHAAVFPRCGHQHDARRVHVRVGHRYRCSVRVLGARHADHQLPDAAVRGPRRDHGDRGHRVRPRCAGPHGLRVLVLCRRQDAAAHAGRWVQQRRVRAQSNEPVRHLTPPPPSAGLGLGQRSAAYLSLYNCLVSAIGISGELCEFDPIDLDRPRYGSCAFYQCYPQYLALVNATGGRYYMPPLQQFQCVGEGGGGACSRLFVWRRPAVLLLLCRQLALSGHTPSHPRAFSPLTLAQAHCAMRATDAQAVLHDCHDEPVHQPPEHGGVAMRVAAAPAVAFCGCHVVGCRAHHPWCVRVIFLPHEEVWGTRAPRALRQRHKQGARAAA